MHGVCKVCKVRTVRKVCTIKESPQMETLSGEIRNARNLNNITE